jgi:hypothetical protein
MTARQLIIETLLQDAPANEKAVAQALDSTFADLESDIVVHKDELAPQQNEAVGFAIAGAVVSLPALLKLIGKAIAKIQSKIKGEEVDTNTIIEVAEKLHNMLIGGVEKVLIHVFKMKDKKAAHRLAVIIFHAIVAGLLIASSAAGFKALQKSNWSAGFLEGLLTAIKSGEMSAFLGAELGQVAKALGMGAELADAADLADALEVGDLEGIDEMSSMGAGSVAGYSLPLGAKPKKDLEENQMNKLKISKGRLRKIIAEEVSRHNGTKLNEMGPDEEKAEAEELAAQTTTAAPYVASMGEAQLEEDRDAEDWEKHFRGGARDDADQIAALKRDEREDKESEGYEKRYLRREVQQALEEMLSEESVDEAKEAKKDYDGDGKVESSTEEWKGSRDKAIKKAEDM